jgi:hypothetical protein
MGKVNKKIKKRALLRKKDIPHRLYDTNLENLERNGKNKRKFD